MLCRFCQVDIRGGTGCQTQSQANKCPNNRGRETGDWDDYITRDFCMTPCSTEHADKENPVMITQKLF